MSLSKSDPLFRTYYDSIDYDAQECSSDDDCTLGQVVTGIGTRRDPKSRRRQWLDAHYDVLEELYKIFLEHGQRAFGAAYFQHGGFHNFIEFTYQHTHEGSTLSNC